MIGGIPHFHPNNIPAGSKVKFIDINSQNDPKPELEGWIMQRVFDNSQQGNDILYNIRRRETRQRYDDVKPSNITELIYHYNVQRTQKVEINQKFPENAYRINIPEELTKDNWWDFYRNNPDPEVQQQQKWPWE